MIGKPTTATRRIQFCAGHRIYRHESKCHNVHGHNYVALFTAVRVDEDVDELGRVMDFSDLKTRLGGWIEANWDHGFIVWEKDLELIAMLQTLPNQKMFVLSRNPTVENMALHLLKEVAPEVLRNSGVMVTKVKLWETENCFAEVR